MPQPFQRLLLATEHTEFDVGAERIAIAIAKQCDLPLGVVRPVVSNPEFEALAPAAAAEVAQAAAAAMDALRAQAHTAGVRIEGRVRSGEEPWREIVEEARARNTDLLITRRRGKSGWLARLMVGTMVSQVVKHAPCSVLMVPRAASMWRGGVLAAVDGSAMTERVACTAAAIAAKCGAPLTVISVAFDASQAARVAAQAAITRACDAVKADAMAMPAGRIEVGGTAHDCILKAADPEGLIVIGRHGHTALAASAFGGVVHKVVGHAAGPVLVVRP